MRARGAARLLPLVEEPGCRLFCNRLTRRGDSGAPLSASQSSAGFQELRAEALGLCGWCSCGGDESCSVGSQNSPSDHQVPTERIKASPRTVASGCWPYDKDALMVGV